MITIKCLFWNINKKNLVQELIQAVLENNINIVMLAEGENVNFYFNPMWNLMGKRNQALGTYYFETDQDDNSFFWYTFDQILIRPELIEDFIWEDFQIIDQIGNDFLIRNNKIYSKKYSDHLPIKFTIEQRRK